MQASNIGDKTSFFEELLEQDKSISIHTRNLQMLATEFCVEVCLLFSLNYFVDVISVIIYEVILILQCQM